MYHLCNKIMHTVVLLLKLFLSVNNNYFKCNTLTNKLPLLTTNSSDNWRVMVLIIHLTSCINTKQSR